MPKWRARMPPEESTRAKYNRLKRQLQDSILSDYPNPERKGCPGDVRITSLAERASDETVENDTSWHHLTHCSECYREFLELRRKLKRGAERTGRIVRRGAIAVLLLTVGFIGWRYSHGRSIPLRHQNAELVFGKITIDIPNMTRSEIASANLPINLQRQATELTVNLPVGSRSGEYEFKLSRGTQQFLAASAVASISNGVTAFTLKIDLSKVPSGSYSMSVRQPPWDWSYVPVVVR
jgi:hypothetical protein